MDCKKVKEELVYLFVDDEMEQGLLLAFRRHVDDCPPCARQALFTREFLALIRRRSARCQAPRTLRERILADLPHRKSVLY